MLTSRRRLIMAVGAMLGMPLARLQANRDVTLTSGILSAGDVEADQGYFAIGQATAVMVRENTVALQHLKQLRGKQIELVIRIIE